MEKSTDGKCRVCGGEIVEKIVEEEDDQRWKSPVVGLSMSSEVPQKQYHKVSKGYHCKKCGIKYEFVSGERKEGEGE